MGKLNKNLRYSLSKNFNFKGKKYKSASSLVSFFKMETSAPLDSGPFSIEASYEGSPTVANEVIGSRTVSAATFSDSSNINARSTDKRFCFSSLASGATSSAGADLPFSISVWVKISSSSSGYNYIFAKDENTLSYFSRYNSTTKALQFAVSDSSGLNYLSIVTYPLNIEDRWVQLACTYSGGTAAATSAYAKQSLKIYIDGAEQLIETPAAAGTYVSMEPEHDQPLFIGGKWDGSEELDGDIAEFAIWSKELSSMEIGAVYGLTKGRQTGYLNNPARTILSDRDNRPGGYHQNKPALCLGYEKNSSPFDDLDSLDTHSSFSKAVFKFRGRHWLDLTSSLGNLKKRFIYVQSKFEPENQVLENNNLWASGYVPVRLSHGVNVDKLKLGGKQKDELIQNSFIRTINSFLLGTPPHEQKGVTYFNKNGDQHGSFGIKAEALKPGYIQLQHTRALTGSFIEDKNIINTGRYSIEGLIRDYTKAKLYITDNSISNQQFSSLNTVLIRYPDLRGVNKNTGTPESKTGNYGISSPNVSSDITLQTRELPHISSNKDFSKTIKKQTPFDDSTVYLLDDTDFFKNGIIDPTLPGFDKALSSKSRITINASPSAATGEDSFVYYSTRSMGTDFKSIEGKPGSGMAYWNHALRRWEMLNAEVDYDLNYNFTSVKGNRYASSANLLSWFRSDNLNASKGTIIDAGPGKNNLFTTASSDGIPTFNTWKDIPSRAGVHNPGAIGNRSARFFKDAMCHKSGSTEFSFGNGTTDSAFSISAWVKFDFVHANHYSHIAAKGGISYTDQPGGWFFGVFDNKITLLVASNAVNNYRYLSGTSVLSADKWYHLAATYDGRGGNGGTTDVTTAGMSLYVNGVKELNGGGFTTSTAYTAMPASTKRFVIGGRHDPAESGHTNSEFKGDILEVALWKSEISHEEVKSLYDQKYSIAEPYSVKMEDRKQSCLGFAPLQPGDPILSNPENHTSVGQPISQFGFPNSNQYNATSSQAIKMSDYISAPFAVEKILVEVDGMFGLSTSTNTLEESPIQKQFFILNQKTNADFPHFSKVLESGLKVSSFDKSNTGTELVKKSRFNQKGVRELLGFSKISFLKQESLFNNDSYNRLIDKKDIYDKLVIRPSSEFTAGGTTGSFSFYMTPSISSYNEFTTAIKLRNTSGSIQYTSEYLLSSEGGSNSDGNYSGRHIAGTIINTTSSNADKYNNFSSDKKFKPSQRKLSPYILDPSDSIILGWQNHPYSLSLSGTLTSNFINSGTLGGSHYNQSSNLVSWYRFKDYRNGNPSISDASTSGVLLNFSATGSATTPRIQSNVGPRRKMSSRSSFISNAANPGSANIFDRAQHLRTTSTPVQSVKFTRNTEFYYNNKTLGTFGDSSNDSAFSFSLWIYIDDNWGSDVWVYPVGKWGAGSGEWYLELSSKSNGRCAVSMTLYDASVAKQAKVTANSSAKTNSWSHIVVTTDGSASSAAGTTNDNGMKIYINSVMPTLSYSTNASYVAMEASSAATQIGLVSATSSGLYGKITEFALWNAELSKSSVEALYSLDPYGIQGTIDDPSEYNLGERIVDRLGKVKLHLLGSFLRKQRPTEDNSHSDQLTSNAVHEFIGGDFLLDKYDVDSTNLLSGTLADNIVKSSNPRLQYIHDPRMLSKDMIANRRGRIASIVSGQAGTTGSINRFIKISDPHRAYSDSLVPQLSYPMKMFRGVREGRNELVEEIQFNGEASKTWAIVLSNNRASGSFKWFSSLGVNFNSKFDLDLIANHTQVANETNSVFIKNPVPRKGNDFNSSVGPFGMPGQDFSKSKDTGFFEPISGFLTTGQAKFIAIDFSHKGESTSYIPWSGSEYHKNGFNNLDNPYIYDGKQSVMSTDFETKNELNKIFFGISAGFNKHAGILPIALDDNPRRRPKTELRGFRYGLYGVTPKSPSNVYRSNHYGFFSDLLEQSPEGKFVKRAHMMPSEPSNFDDRYSIPIEDPPVRVKFIRENSQNSLQRIEERILVINPEETNSHNLSTYCTSSFPYFDNEVRERFSPTPDSQDRIDLESGPAIAIDEN